MLEVLIWGSTAAAFLVEPLTSHAQGTCSGRACSELMAELDLFGVATLI